MTEVAGSPMVGRNPDQSVVFDVTYKAGNRTVGSGRMSSLPPVGWVYVEDGKLVRGAAGYVGVRYRVTGGELLEPSKSTTSTLCVTEATVFVEKID